MKKQLNMMLAFLLVLIMIPAGAFAAEEARTVSLEVLKSDSDEPSATSRYIDNKAEIVTENGNTYAIVILKDAAWWQSLKTQTVQPGTFEETNFAEAEVLSENEEENTRVVKFLVPDLNEVLNAKIHIVVTGIPGMGSYEHSYDIRFKFTAEAATEEGAVHEAEEEEPAAAEDTPASATIEDGEYTIGYQVLHEKEDKASSMARYIVAPADLTVKDGVNTVTFTLTNNEQITAFQVEVDGEFVDADVVHVDEEANTRTVSFEVADLSVMMNAKVQVYVAAQNYTGNHVVRIAFDQDSIQAVNEEEVQAVNFEDIETSWAKPYIEALASKNIIQGVSEHHFAPEDPITRVQFAVLLARTLDLPLQAYEGVFSDVTEQLSWAVQEVEAAHRAGIVYGSNGKFNPGEHITREQIVTMVVRAIEYTNPAILESVEQALSFADADQIRDYAKTNVGYAAGLGLINGMDVNGSTVFAPAENATRAQAAKVIYELMEILK